MVKKAKSPVQKLDSITTKYNKDFIKTSLGLLWCRICNKSVSYKKKYSISSHRTTITYQSGLNSNSIPDRVVSHSKASFAYDLICTFISSIIHMNKLRTPEMKNLLEKYELPSVSQSYRQSLVKKIAEENIVKMKEIIKK